MIYRIGCVSINGSKGTLLLISKKTRLRFAGPAKTYSFRWLKTTKTLEQIFYTVGTCRARLIQLEEGGTRERSLGKKGVGRGKI